MDEFSSAVGGLSGAASLGGAGGAFSSLIPSAAPIPDLFPRLSKPLDGRFERFYRVLSFEESKSVPGSAGGEYTTCGGAAKHSAIVRPGS